MYGFTHTRAVGALLLAIVLVSGTAWAQPKGKAPRRGKKATAAAPAVDIAATKAQLSGADVDRATAAAAQLGQVRQPAALDALLDALALGLHPRVAAAALEAVAGHAPASALDVLLAYARNRNPEVRAKAILALGTLENAKALAAWKEAFTDGDKQVRAAAAKVAANRKHRPSAEPLLALLKKGDEAAAPALATLANAEVARLVAEMIGEAPDALLVDCLGAILMRKDLGKEDVYVELVRAIGKIPGDESVVALTAYVSAIPETPPRQSRREAQILIEQRLGGGQ